MKHQQDGKKDTSHDYPLMHSRFGPLCSPRCVEKHGPDIMLDFPAAKARSEDLTARDFLKKRLLAMQEFVKVGEAEPEQCGFCAICNVMFFETVAQILVAFEVRIVSVVLVVLV